VATVSDCLGYLWKTLDADGVYVIDGFPVAVCDNVRIRCAKLYRDETYRGYQASKRRYFYGLKVHLMVTSAGQPVERVLTPGSVADVQVLKSYVYDLPPGSVVYADKAYNDDQIEDPDRAGGRLCLPRWKTSTCFRYARRIQSARCRPRGGFYSPIIVSGWRRRGVN